VGLLAIRRRLVFLSAIAGLAAGACSAAPPGQDFASDARLLYRIAACADSGPIPPPIDRAVVERHCAWLRPRIERYRQRYLEKGRPFFAQVLPRGLPRTAVYPFGGGDLVTALTTYADVGELTTLSLELVGDPSRATVISPEALDENLTELRHSLVGLLSQNDSTSLNLMKVQVGGLPGQLVFFLIGLAIHGYEPVSLRYFRLEPDGSLHFYTADEVRAYRGRLAARRKSGWTRPDFSEVFANSELAFRPAGAGPRAPLRIHRHIAANLDDHSLVKDLSVLAYLERRGRMVAMTKASSYTLWNRKFSRIRDYLLANMDVMVSDSTGIPPSHAAQAGFVQETYGKFTGSFLPTGRVYNEQFRALWADQPYRELNFRYGYLDSEMNYHMVITRRGPHAPRRVATTAGS
jgi:hypothetical protein